MGDHHQQPTYNLVVGVSLYRNINKKKDGKSNRKFRYSGAIQSAGGTTRLNTRFAAGKQGQLTFLMPRSTNEIVWAL
jgi:hypothetical protein